MSKFLSSVVLTLLLSMGFPSLSWAEESVFGPTSETVIDATSSLNGEMVAESSPEEGAPGNADVWIAEGGTAQFTTPEGEVTYDYEDVNGLAVAEGDIILGPIEEFKEGGNDQIRSRGLIVTRQMGKDWPNGVIPYVIASDFLDRSLVVKAIEEYHKKTSLRFVRRTTQNDHIRYVNQLNFLASMSDIGRQGGGQEIKINFFWTPDGSRASDSQMVTTIVHETAHALGMKHEQSRSDRDSSIQFDQDCEFDKRFWYEITGNYAKATDFQMAGVYDLDSVMQYPSTPGTKKDTGTACYYFVRKDNGGYISGGDELSPGDVQTMAQRYGAFRTSSTTTVVGGGGGTAYTLDCPSNQVLVGIKGRAGSWIDRIHGVCVKVNYDGSWSGGTTTTSYKGGSGGTAFSRTCASGYAVSGISGRAGSLVDQIRIYCRKLVNATNDGLKNAGRLTGSRTGLSSVGGGGGQAFGRYDCLDNMPGRGLRGRSGSSLDRIQLYCRVGSTLPSTPTLISPAQHANLGGTRQPQLQYTGGYKATQRTVMLCPANANSGYCRTGASNTISFTGGETAARVPRDLAPGQYKWHVTAGNGVGQTKSTIRLFSVLPGPRVIMVKADAGKLCRGTSTGNYLTARLLNDGLGGASQTVKVSLYWAAFNPETGYVPSGGALKTIDIGGLSKNQSKTATFKNILLPSTARSLDVLLMKTTYPDGLPRDKQAVINVGKNLDTYRNCLARNSSTKLSSYPTYYRTITK